MSWEWECVWLTFRWRINVYPFLCSNYAKVYGPSVNDFMFSCWAILADQIQSVSHSLIEFHESWYIQSITSANRCCDSWLFCFIFALISGQNLQTWSVQLWWHEVCVFDVEMWWCQGLSEWCGWGRLWWVTLLIFSVATDKYANADAHTWTMNCTFIYLYRLYI